MQAPERHTLDASVLLAAFNPAEAAHAEASKFLAALRDAGLPIIMPALVFPEVAATINRTQAEPSLAVGFANALKRLPNLVVVALDEDLGLRAATIAAQHRLRGADAIYAAVAQQYGCVLVTLDREQRERAPASVRAKTPGQAIKSVIRPT